MRGGGGRGHVGAPLRSAFGVGWPSGAEWGAAKRPGVATLGHQGPASPEAENISLKGQNHNTVSLTMTLGVSGKSITTALKTFLNKV